MRVRERERGRERQSKYEKVKTVRCLGRSLRVKSRKLVQNQRNDNNNRRLFLFKKKMSIPREFGVMPPHDIPMGTTQRG